jgi:hypothetical protein
MFDTPDPETQKNLLSEVLTYNNPNIRLFELIGQLMREERYNSARWLFESAMSRFDVTFYWTFVGMATTYLNLNRPEAAFVCAARAAQIDRKQDGAFIVNDIMFRHFRREGRARDALDLFDQAFEHLPSSPLATVDVINELRQQAGLEPLAASETMPAAGRHNRRVVDASTKPAWACPAVHGGLLPDSLAWLNQPIPRNAIDVAEIQNAEVLILDSAVLVLAEGAPQPDISICDFPDAFRRHFEQAEVNGRTIETLALDEIVMIADRLGGNNFGHFLIDQIPRLALFAGLTDLENPAILGPEVTTKFQADILSTLGLTRYLGNVPARRLRVGRLLATTDAVNPQLIAHFGETWGIDFMRQRLGLQPIASAAANTGKRRLYITRNDGHGRRIVNEDEIMPLLDAHGFERINPDRLSFQEQVDLFSHASHVCGVHGAGLSNIIFAPPGLRFLEIFHPLFVPNNFAQLVPALQMDYTAMVARDGLTEAPEMNDPTLPPHWDVSAPFPWRFRDVRVETSLIAEWLQEDC